MRCELVQWRRGARTKAKLEHYIKWKHDVAWECYLDNADEQARRRMTKARTGIWELRIETGRWESVSAGGASMRTPRHLRWCQQCYLETEDLEHLLLSCPGYVKVRKEFFGRCVRDLRVPPTARALAVSLAAKGSCPRAAATSTPAETLLEWLMAEGALNMRCATSRNYGIDASSYDMMRMTKIRRKSRGLGFLAKNTCINNKLIYMMCRNCACNLIHGTIYLVLL